MTQLNFWDYRVGVDNIFSNVEVASSSNVSSMKDFSFLK